MVAVTKLIVIRQVANVEALSFLTDWRCWRYSYQTTEMLSDVVMRCNAQRISTQNENRQKDC